MDKSVASRCRELLQFLKSAKGDLANVTGPPALLAPSSVVEVGHCWAQHPAVFAAPALEPDAERRCLLVLQLMLVALRSQVYIGGSTKTSIRKPLNAFLGELFLAEWTAKRTHSDGTRARQNSSGSSSDFSCCSDGSSDSDDATSILDHQHMPACHCGGARFTTRLVAEQVSHHPPITAMHLADEIHGVRADGYARVEMTFTGSVQVRQIGHALVHVDRYDEDYLLPLPDVHVRGFLSGRLYPEILGSYRILSSTGCSVDLAFSGQGLLFTRGKRNAFVAHVRRPDGTLLYTVEGIWSEGWTITDARTGCVLERFNLDADHNAPAPITLPDLADQDPWESRRAWKGVIDGIQRGDLAQTVAEKTCIEQAQRRMRADEAAAGKTWQPLLFCSSASSTNARAARDTFHRLAAGTDWQLHDDRTRGVWRVDESKICNLQRPFHGGLTPLG